MSVLTKKEIMEYLAKKEITSSPDFDALQLHAHSVDLRLGFTFLIPKRWHVTSAGREALQMDYLASERPQYFDVVELEKGQYFELFPGEYILVSSLESIKLPNDVMAVMYPRSSTNRKGVSVDLTGIIDSGYEGQLIIPIRNNTPSQTVRLYPGERFCQLVFERLNYEVSARKSAYHQRDIVEGVRAEQSREYQAEMQLILDGNIKQLKSDYHVNL